MGGIRCHRWGFNSFVFDGNLVLCSLPIRKINRTRFFNFFRRQIWFFNYPSTIAPLLHLPSLHHDCKTLIRFWTGCLDAIGDRNCSLAIGAILIYQTFKQLGSVSCVTPSYPTSSSPSPSICHVVSQVLSRTPIVLTTNAATSSSVWMPIKCYFQTVSTFRRLAFSSQWNLFFFRNKNTRPTFWLTGRETEDYTGGSWKWNENGDNAMIL